MGSSGSEETDYRDRFEHIKALESARDAFVLEVLEKLEVVTEQLELVTDERTKEVLMLRADLESEKESRRGWQDRAQASRERLSLMDRARFVLVLIDADADMYLFHQKFLAHGLLGGQAAADEFMLKAKEYLASVGIEDTIPVVVKAYANLSGLAQACARDKKVKTVADVVQFWIGFSRRLPLVDFVDVGAGKEEADNKIREVLASNIANPQCEQVLLACCHDAGYAPALRQYAANPSHSKRVCLVSAGAVRAEVANLGFCVTNIFEPLFWREVMWNRVHQQSRESLPAVVLSPLRAAERMVENSDRLGPIKRNAAQKRVDKPLNVRQSTIQAIRKKDLCTWHYLRSDCTLDSCKRNHTDSRPLSSEDFDALWWIARHGQCHTARRGSCEDDRCIYGHGTG